MLSSVGAFSSLYFATLMLLLSSGLFNTFMGVRLTAISVSEVWIGGLIAVYYLGLVFGARMGHRLIMGVGHIRAYAASAAIVTICVLVQILVDSMYVWLLLRFLAGAAMVVQFMGIESWLNEQSDNSQRGTIFAIYMVFSSLGTVLGQLSLTLFPHLNFEPLVFVAICSAFSLVPVAITRRSHPPLQVPAPINARYYVDRVPLSMMVLLVAGMLTGAFYGLAPVYAVRVHLSNEQAALFVAVSVAAGVLAQWPVGWLADRMSRVKLIRINAICLLALAIPLWGWFEAPFWFLLIFSALFGVLQFTLYPLGAAFANDNVDPERRVGLSAILYMVYGLGACLGPLLAGGLMSYIGSNLYYIFVAACGLALVLLVRPQKVLGDHLSQDAPTTFVPMPDSLQSSAAAVALDPRVDISSDVSHDPVFEDLPPVEERVPATTESTAAERKAEDEAAEATLVEDDKGADPVAGSSGGSVGLEDSGKPADGDSSGGAEDAGSKRKPSDPAP